MNNYIRKASVSESFYPSNKNTLVLMIKNFFKKTKKIVGENKIIKALVVPHAGYVYSGQTAAWGYAQLSNDLKNHHFVLVGPSHNFSFVNLCLDNSINWQTPIGEIKHFVQQKNSALVFVDDKPHLPEHSLEVQLPFLQSVYKDFSISAFLTGYSVDHQKISDYFINNFPNSIFIISSDLSHYLSQKEAKLKDKKTIEAILNLDRDYFINEENAACGRFGIMILIEMAKKLGWKTKLVYYDTSAYFSKDTNNVVGYSSIVFYEI